MLRNVLGMERTIEKEWWIYYSKDPVIVLTSFHMGDNQTILNSDSPNPSFIFHLHVTNYFPIQLESINFPFCRVQSY
jgi:hypothetical protein